jgi:hypothetical protein
VFCFSHAIHNIWVLSIGGGDFLSPQAFRPIMSPLWAPVFTRALRKSPVLNAGTRSSFTASLSYLSTPTVHSRRSSFSVQPELYTQWYWDTAWKCTTAVLCLFVRSLVPLEAV